MNTAQVARRIIATWRTEADGDTEALFHLIDDELRSLVAQIGGLQITVSAQQTVIERLQKELDDVRRALG